MEKKQTKMLEAAEDRLSNLPESLLHHILSFLDILTVFQTRVLSTTRRHVWSSAPVLNFDSSLKRAIPRTHHFVYFVDRFLHFRNNSSTIHRISLSREYCSDSRQLATWLFIALKQHVKEIHFEINCNEPCFFLQTLFTSQIEVVKLKQHQILSRVPVQPLKLMCSAPQLRTLELAYVALPEGDSSGKLILSYPVLENLILDRCPHDHLNVLQISSVRLKSLAIINESGRNYSCSTSIDVCAPNLKCLQLVYSHYKCYSLGNLSSLATANIGVRRTLSVLYNLRTVTTLELFSPCQLNTYAASRNKFCRVLGLFSNLKCLILSELHCGSCIRDMAKLLNSSSRVETLVFSLSKDYRLKKDKEGSRKKLLPGNRIDKLQNVNARHFTCSNHELGILAFLLRNAKRLKKITLSSTPVSKEKELAEFRKKLHSVPKASSDFIYVTHQR